jgi:hypothetical protein
MAFINSLALRLKFICDDQRANGGLHVAAPRWPDLPAVSARPAMAYVPIVLSKSHRVVLSRLGPDPEEFGVLHRTGRQRGNGGLAVFSFGGTSSCNQQRFSAKESGQAAASRSNLRWLQVHDLNLRFDKF